MPRADGIAKARAIRTERTKGKIRTAIDVLRIYGSKITVRAIAEEAGISTTTAAKYLKQIQEAKVSQPTLTLQ